jgi:hypothetical protein
MNLAKHLIATLGLLAIAAMLTNSLPGCAEAVEAESVKNTELNPIKYPATEATAPPAQDENEPSVAVDPESFARIEENDSPLFKPSVAVAETEPVAETMKLGSEPVDAPERSRLSVLEVATCLNVESRIPEGISSHFSTDSGAVWAYVKVNNPGEKSHITMVWKRDNQVRAKMRLPVGTSPRWRTWSRMRIRQYDVGEWTVEVRDDNDLLLKEILFDVKAPTDIKS